MRCFPLMVYDRTLSKPDAEQRHPMQDFSLFRVSKP
jgi:hypothetical protein